MHPESVLQQESCAFWERPNTEPGCWLGRKATYELMCGPGRVSEQALSKDAAGKPKLEPAVALSLASILDIKTGCAAFPKEPSSKRSGLFHAQTLIGCFMYTAVYVLEGGLGQEVTLVRQRELSVHSFYR